MANGADFVLKLIDRVTAPARAMARSLGAVTTAQKAIKASSVQAQAGITSMGNAAARAGAQAAAAAASMRSLSTVQHRFKSMGGRALTGSLSELGSFSGARHGPVFDRAAQRKQMSFWSNLKIDSQPLLKWNAAAGEGIEKWQELSAVFMRTPFGMVIGGLGSIVSGLVDMVASIASAIAKATALGLAVGGVLAAAFAKSTVEMAAFGESSAKAFGYILGDQAMGAPMLDYAIKAAKELGQSAKDTVNQFKLLTSKQFSIKESKELIQLASDLKIVTGDAQAADRALVAISQIKSKTKLQAEELQGQLAENGVPVDLVYQNLEKSMNTDRAGVMKALQKGLVGSDVGIDAIKKAIKQMLGTDQAGQLGKDFAQNTLDGLLGQLENAGDNFKLDLRKYIDIEPVKQSIRDLMKALDGVDKVKVGTFVQKMISGFAKLTPVVIAFAEGFMDGFGSIIQALTFGDGEVKDKARDAGRWLADFFGKAITLTGKLMDIVIPAVEEFLKGLDLNSVLDSLNGTDWKQFGADLAVIANALGSITAFAAKLIHPVASVGGFLFGDPLKESQQNSDYEAPLSKLFSGLFGGSPAAGSEAAPRNEGGGGGSRSVQITQNITASGNDAASIGLATRRAAEDALLSSGTAPMSFAP